MNLGKKVIASFLIAAVLIAALSLVSFSGFLDLIETHFYNPSIIRGYTDSLARVSRASDAYHEQAMALFTKVLGDAALRRFVHSLVNAADADAAIAVLDRLHNEMPGLVGLRLIDSDGKKLHYSNFQSDIIRDAGKQTTYRRYGGSGDLAYSSIAVLPGAAPAPRIEAAEGCFLYALPFFDDTAVYRGTALFYVEFEDLVSFLVNEGLLSGGSSARPIGGRGLIFRYPTRLDNRIFARVTELWNAPSVAASMRLAALSDASYILFSKPGRLSGYSGFIVPSDVFNLSPTTTWLLLACFFTTLYLLIFFLLNLRQDRMLVLADRIKRFQLGFLEEYLRKKDDVDLDRWRREIMARKGEIAAEIKKSSGRLHRLQSKKADELIERGWDEIVSALGGQARTTPGLADQSEIGGLALRRLLAETAPVLPGYADLRRLRGVDRLVTPSISPTEGEAVHGSDADTRHQGEEEDAADLGGDFLLSMPSASILGGWESSEAPRPRQTQARVGGREAAQKPPAASKETAAASAATTKPGAAGAETAAKQAIVYQDGIFQIVPGTTAAAPALDPELRRLADQVTGKGRSS